MWNQLPRGVSVLGSVTLCFLVYFSCCSFVLEKDKIRKGG